MYCIILSGVVFIWYFIHVSHKSSKAFDMNSKVRHVTGKCKNTGSFTNYYAIYEAEFDVKSKGSSLGNNFKLRQKVSSDE